VAIVRSLRSGERHESEFGTRLSDAHALCQRRTKKEEIMKKVLSGVAIVAMLWLAASVSRAQDSAKGEKTFKAKCAGCHGADAAGKPAVKSPSIKGKSADELTKVFSTSPKHASLKKLTPADVNDLAAYLATLK
jgi:mono/diheme cytochrome c family protein